MVSIVSTRYGCCDVNIRPLKSVRRCLSEAIGTFILTCVIGFDFAEGKANLFSPLKIGSCLMVMFYAFSDVSDAHFNPAVSLISTIKTGSRHPWWDTCFYICNQLLAGYVGGWLVLSLHDNKDWSFLPLSQEHTIQEWARIGLVECLYTFMLAFVILNVTNRRRESNGLAIGFTLVAAVSSVAWVSGALLNPAVALGMFGVSSPRWLFYSLFQCLGAGIAKSLFSFLRVVKTTEELLEEQNLEVEIDLPPKLTERLVCEFLGAFFITLSIGMSSVGEHVPPLAAIATFVCLHYAIGDLSGGHFNPCVTLAVWIRNYTNKMHVFTALEAFYYCSTQLAAGVAAGLCYVMISQKSVPVGPHIPHSEHFYGQMGVFLFVEAFFTSVFVFVFLVLTASRTFLVTFQSLIIGFALLVGGFAAIVGHLNPAVSVGLDVAHATKNEHFGTSVLLTFAQCIGAVAFTFINIITK